MGNYQVTIKVEDGATPTASTTKNFTINVGNAGGAVPGITNVTPGGGAQGSATTTLTITGTNTSFSGSSVVSFTMPQGTSGTVGITTGTVTF